MNIYELQENFKDEEFRNQDHKTTFTSLSVMLNSICKHTEENQKNLLEIFRALRNSCINCRRNQNDVVKSGIPEITVKILVDDSWIFEGFERMKTAGLQFLGNLVSGNEDAQNCVWKIGFPGFYSHFIKEQFTCENHFAICSMIFYNCLSNSNTKNIFSDDVGENLIKIICNALCSVSNSDWIVLCITEYFLEETKFLPFVMSNCAPEVKNAILEIYCNKISETNDHQSTECSNFTAVYLIEVFVENCRNLCDGEEDFDFIVILLKALCWATATPGEWSLQAKISNLVETAVELLSGITKLTRSPDLITDKNMKLHNLCSHLSKSSSRRDLIRLVGNLCYENPSVQDQIRSLGAIPLILDACSIDDGNPFMQQWVVFAVRNLCDGNPLNQAEIAKLEKLGVADSPVLRDMGLTAIEDENGKMRVIPLK